jgi:hypothetical protein
VADFERDQLEPQLSRRVKCSVRARNGSAIRPRAPLFTEFTTDPAANWGYPTLRALLGSRKTAEELASTSSERAVIAVLAPACADKFGALPYVAARTATLVANKDNSNKMREAFPEAMITLPGKGYPDSDLTAAQECTIGR